MRTSANADGFMNSRPGVEGGCRSVVQPFITFTPGFRPGIPSTVERPLDLYRELKQQAVIGLLRDRLDAERQAVRVRCEQQWIARMPHRLASGVKAKLRHRLLAGPPPTGCR